MNIAARIRRSFFREEKKELPSVNGSSSGNEEDLLGVTDELIDHVRSFTIDTFKNFSLYDEEACVNPLEEEEEEVSSNENVKKDLSDWQERHAVLVLSKSKELSQLRFKLCPRLLKEDQFWKIYFKLVRNLVAKYEVQAIQRALIRRMAMEASETKGVYEVEMSETKPRLTSTGPATP
ncbi:BSD domain-containing protein [Hirschfeldia incana]|nr:BSD domain-containing protein [Hirschfeldia incana]